MEELVFRKARAADLPAIVAMLADDPLGAEREDTSRPLAHCYREAFAAIDGDPHQILVVGTVGETAIATLQITLIPGLSRKGAWRGQIEAVRVAQGHRNAEVGRAAIEWAIAACRSRGCSVVQLTTDKSRADAHRFYERLGFGASHVGYKKFL
jgi:GNAT superfamily N-acetyltransferase